MFRKILLFLALCMFMPSVVVFTQESEQEEVSVKKEDFWIGLGGDAALYSVSGAAYGGSFALGYGSGASIGLKVSWFFWEEGFDTLELNFLLRLYLLGMNAYSGPFLQIMGGPALFNRTGDFSIPSRVGAIQAGLCFGWRFVLLDRLFVEPYIRGGYPYIAGAGVLVGVRF